MKESRHGSLFQIYKAMYKNDLDFVIVVCCVGSHIDMEEDQSDRLSTYRGIRATR